MQTHEAPPLVKTFNRVGRASHGSALGFFPRGVSPGHCAASLLASGGPAGFSPLTLVSHQVSGVAWDVLDEMRPSAGRGDLIEVHGPEKSGVAARRRGCCLLITEPMTSQAASP